MKKTWQFIVTIPDWLEDASPTDCQRDLLGTLLEKYGQIAVQVIVVPDDGFAAVYAKKPRKAR